MNVDPTGLAVIPIAREAPHKVLALVAVRWCGEFDKLKRVARVRGGRRPDKEGGRWGRCGFGRNRG